MDRNESTRTKVQVMVMVVSPTSNSTAHVWYPRSATMVPAQRAVLHVLPKVSSAQFSPLVLKMRATKSGETQD
jgi:hypothetical protein